MASRSQSNIALTRCKVQRGENFILAFSECALHVNLGLLSTGRGSPTPTFNLPLEGSESTCVGRWRRLLPVSGLHIPPLSSVRQLCCHS